MPRFRDEWVVDRVLFDYVSGGSCSCCGLQHFLPNGVADLIGAVSDLDTDQQNNEVAALAFHPWPRELREQVWSDRVRLRQKLKLDKKKYQTLWMDDARRRDFLDWCRRPETIQNYRRWFQLSRSEIMDTVQSKYNIHSAFGVVICAVVEQVAFFPLTEYPADGRGTHEVEFEKLLTFDRRGGFTLPLMNEDENGVQLNEMALLVWLNEMEHNVGSPGKQLLVRKASNTSANNEDEAENIDQEGGDPDDGTQQSMKAKTSFASDRRIVRLLIARMWAELLESKFKEQEINL